MAEKKKKVLFVATVDSHIELFHLPYLKMFHDKGWEVHVATETGKKIPYCDKKIKLPIKRSPFKLISNHRAIKKLREVAKKEKYDIVHCHTPVGGVVARLACKKLRREGLRMIYTAHGFHFYTGAPVHYWMMFYPVEWYLAKYTDTLITINDEDYQRAKKRLSKRCRDIQYVPGVGVDEKKFEKKLSAKEKHALRESLGLKDDDEVLICVGRLDKNKNQGFLIRAMKELAAKDSAYQLLLVGPDELHGKYQKLVDKLGVREHVKFLGFREDIPELLQISDIAVSASKREGLPVNLIEAAMVGLPIVATDCRGNRDVCKECNGAIMNQEDEKKFVDKIRKSNKGISKYPGNYCSAFNIMVDKVYQKPGTVLIIPSCNDLNRGDQALVLETMHLAESVYEREMNYYMMGINNVDQCKKYGIGSFSDILLHPSRKDKSKKNVRYGMILKVRWGIVAIFDYMQSKALLNNFLRSIVRKTMSREKKKSLDLYDSADAIFVKGGGFLHDYSGGLIGLYTVYYHLFHIKLALAMGKKVYVMPNSFGPFASKKASKMVREVLDRCVVVTARESISASGKTNGLGYDIVLSPDLAFYMKENNSGKARLLLEKNGLDIKRDKMVAITARPYRFYRGADSEVGYQKYKDSLKALIVHLLSLGYKVLLVVHTHAENQHEDDESCLDELLSSLDNKDGVYKIKDKTMDCYDLKELYGYCQFVIGTRFHSVIFSLQQLIPCIAITYGGNKGDGIMRDMNLAKYAIKIDEIDEDKIVRVFDDLEIKKELYTEKVAKYMEYAFKQRENLIDLIKRS